MTLYVRGKNLNKKRIIHDSKNQFQNLKVNSLKEYEENDDDVISFIHGNLPNS